MVQKIQMLFLIFLIFSCNSENRSLEKMKHLDKGRKEKPIENVIADNNEPILNTDSIAKYTSDKQNKKPKSDEEIILEIRKEFNEINSNIGRFYSQFVELNNTKYIGWFELKEIKKLLITRENFTEEIYFKDGCMIFQYDYIEKGDISTENRYYYKNVTSSERIEHRPKLVKCIDNSNVTVLGDEKLLNEKQDKLWMRISEIENLISRWKIQAKYLSLDSQISELDRNVQRIDNGVDNYEIVKEGDKGNSSEFSEREKWFNTEGNLVKSTEISGADHGAEIIKRYFQNGRLIFIRLWTKKYRSSEGRQNLNPPY